MRGRLVTELWGSVKRSAILAIMPTRMNVRRLFVTVSSVSELMLQMLPDLVHHPNARARMHSDGYRIAAITMVQP